MGWDMKRGLEGLDHNFLTGKLEDLVKWARASSSSGRPTFGLACCAIEMMATGGAHYDLPASAWRCSGPRPARPTS